MFAMILWVLLGIAYIIINERERRIRLKLFEDRNRKREALFVYSILTEED